MASSDDPKEKLTREENAEEPDGFLGKIKDFVHDVGEKIGDMVDFGKPTADVSAIHITHVDTEKLDLTIDVLITNPNPIPIPLVDINYVIESDGRKLISGLIPDMGTIKPHGSETVPVPLKLIFDDIKSTYTDLKSGTVVPYVMKAHLIVDVPVIGRITIPIEKTGEIPVPCKPEANLMKIKFNDFSMEETTATVHLRLDNKNDFDLGLNFLEYKIHLGDIDIGGARISKSNVIAKNDAGTLEIPISFRPKDFGSALWDMMRGKGMGYSINGSLEVQTPFGPMNLPFSKEGGRTRLKKVDDDDDDDEDEKEE